ncbi:MAG TPA: hypothetical protein DEP12_04750 [Planctomycetaceae bacterium]|nr:hypothetical protein [Planctomycetaceae bacterium]
MESANEKMGNSLSSELSNTHSTLITYDSCAHHTESGWEFPVSGHLLGKKISRMRERFLNRLLLRFAQVDLTDQDSPEFALVQRRIQPFIRKAKKKVPIGVRLGGSYHKIASPTRRGGRFKTTVNLSSQAVSAFLEYDTHSQPYLPIRGVADLEQTVTIPSRCYLVDPVGISVVTDIDDTIKDSQVLDRRQLLRNSFAKPYEPVKGMKEVFEAWQQKAVKFHYVSASPWQIYNELHPFLDHTGFPGGSFHLRQFTLKGQVIRKLIRRRYQKKRNQIESLLQRFPRRQFVLIGDSGEHDSDIYGSLARQYGEQVRKIWIRSLAGNPLDLTRSLEAFRDVPKTTWRIFHEASELSL